MAQNLVLNILAKDKTKVALRGVQAGLSNLKRSLFSVQSAIVGIGAGLVITSFINVGREMLGFTSGVAVTVEETKKRLDEVFGPNGKFGEAAKFLGTTFDGTLSMIQDKIFQFQLGTNEAGFFDFIKGGLITINELLAENEKKLKDFSQRLGTGLVSFIEEAVVGIVGLFNMTKGFFMMVVSGIKGVIDIINFLPPVVRELGILGFLMLGTKGRVLVLALGLVINQIKKLLQSMGVDLDMNFKHLLEMEDATKKN